MNLKLVDRKYDNTFRIERKSAYYYLTKDGMRYLRENFSVDERAIHTMYKNASVSETYAQHCLDIFRAYLSLHTKYPETFTIHTRPEVLEFDHMPDPTPDLSLDRSNVYDSGTYEYLLDILTNTQFFIIKKRIDLYVKHFDDGEWTKGAYPTVLIVCDNSNVEDKIARYVQKQLDDNYIDERVLVFKTTTKKALFDSDHTNRAIWSTTAHPQKTINLDIL
jgi:hypothetical protein